MLYRRSPRAKPPTAPRLGSLYNPSYLMEPDSRPGYRLTDNRKRLPADSPLKTHEPPLHRSR